MKILVATDGSRAGLAALRITDSSAKTEPVS